MLIGVIQKGILSPDETQPTTAQIWGAFVISDGAMINYSDWPTSYSQSRAWGKLYYKPAVGLFGRLSEGMAGLEGDGRNQGGRGGSATAGMSHGSGPLTSKLAAPDTYPLNVGLVVMAKADDPGGDMTR